MLFADMALVLFDSDPVGLSIETFAITDTRCRPQVVSTQ